MSIAVICPGCKASIYRKEAEKLLKKSVDFICKAQTSKDHKLAEGKTVKIGGWGYVSAAETGNGGFDGRQIALRSSHTVGEIGAGDDRDSLTPRHAQSPRWEIVRSQHCSRTQVFDRDR